jgi:hypothetical protein
MIAAMGFQEALARRFKERRLGAIVVWLSCKQAETSAHEFRPGCPGK